MSIDRNHLEQLLDIYKQNAFVNLLDMQVVSLKPGKVEIRMPIHRGKHTNLYGMAHGGALASLADTVMGYACATLGNRVVTLDINMNFIKGAEAQRDVLAVGQVIHHGKSTMVVEADILDEAGALLVKARGTFYVVGKVEVNNE